MAEPRPLPTVRIADAVNLKREVMLRQIVLLCRASPKAFVVALLGLLAIVAVVVYQIAYAGRIYPGVVTVDGLALGSLTQQDAANALTQRTDPFAQRELRLRYGDKEWPVPLETLGVKSNAESVLDAAFSIGRQGNVLQQLGEQLDALRSGRVVAAPLLILNEQQASSVIAKLAKEIDRPAISARLVIDANYQVSIAPSQVGRELNVKDAVQSLAQASTSLSTDTLDLLVTETPPAVTEGDLELSRTLVARMLSGPLTLQFENRTWTLSRQDIAGLLGLDDLANAALNTSRELDESKLTRYVRRLAEEIDQDPRKPRLEFNSGQLRVIREGRPGYKLDQNATAAAIRTQVTTDNRTVKPPVQVTLPPGMSGDRAAIKELVSTATTNYGGGLPERLFNVELAASKLNGVVIGPGEIFSFNEELGPMTLQAGFKWGWGITQSEGKAVTIPSVAGGICQVSTTLFQAIFWAGYQIEERNWHLYWIDRYGQPPKGMKGLDATVDQVYDANGNLVSAIDLKFKNTTPYPILIQAKTDGARLTFSLYSTKPDWEVKVDPPKIEDVVKADKEIVREVMPSLPPGREIWIEAAQDGFKSTIVRMVLENGKEPRVLKLVSTYQPSRNVLAVGPSPERQSTPAATPSPTPTPTPPEKKPAE